jgi:hypothetical protein
MSPVTQVADVDVKSASIKLTLCPCVIMGSIRIKAPARITAAKAITTWLTILLWLFKKNPDDSSMEIKKYYNI